MLSFTGRRKTAVASIKDGAKTFMVNGKTLEQYFGNQSNLINKAESPFIFLGINRMNFSCKISGGGLSSQSESLRLAISRYLAKINEDYSKKLRSAGFTTRDPREVERKKSGKAKARRSFQSGKR